MDNTQEFKKKLAAAIHVAVEERTKDTERRIMTSLGKDVAELLKPFLRDLATSSKTSKENLREVMQELAGSASSREFAGLDTGAIIEAIYVAFGNVQMPQPKITVTSPKIDIPKLQWPEGNMPIEGWVRLQGYDYKNPMPVQLWDGNGRPIDFSGLMRPVAVGGGGGKIDFFTIKDIRGSSASLIDQVEGALKVTGSFTATIGSTYAQLVGPDGQITSANPLPVTIASGSTGGTQYDDAGNAAPGTGGLAMARDAAGSVYAMRIGAGDMATAQRMVMATDAVASMNVVTVSDIFSTTTTSVVVNPDNRVRVELPAGTTGLTDTELRASAVPMAQVSGASWSTALVSVSDIFSTTSASNVVNPDNRIKVELPATSVTVSSITASTAASIVDSSGVGYSGSNPLPITVVSGALTSTISVGPSAVGVADDGSAPVQTAGIARTANPGKVSGGQVVKNSADAVGRQLTRPVQARELLLTAYVQLTTGTEATLLAAQAGFYSDMIYIMGANASDAAVSVDIRPVTAGNVVLTLQLPASGTAGIAMPVPLPQTDTGNNWTADMADITGTTVSLTALFSKEV